MKKDVISVIVSVMIVGASTVMGIVMPDRTEISDSTGIYNESKVIENKGETALIPVSSDTAAKETGVFHTSAESGLTSALQTTSVSFTTSVSETTVTTAETTVITTAEITEAPVQTDSPEIHSEPEPEPQQPTPEPERQPDPQPEPEPEPDPVPTAPDSATEFQRELYSLVNEFREQNGVKPLVCTEIYNHGAQIRAEEIVSLFEHRRPDGRGWETIFTDIGASGGYTGENIAAGSSTPQDVFNQWLDSPDHRTNMLRPQYRIIGIGYCFNPDSEYSNYWVQLFG